MCELKKVEYDVTIRIKAIHVFDGVENLKSDSEFANDIGNLICDEIATSNGVAFYEVKESQINVT